MSDLGSDLTRMLAKWILLVIAGGVAVGVMLVWGGMLVWKWLSR